MLAEGQPGFKVEQRSGYVIERFWGDIGIEHVAGASAKLRQLMEQTPFTKLLCDLCDVDYEKVDLDVQAEGMKQVWLLKNLDRIAFLTAEEGMQEMVERTIKFFNLDSYRIFTDEAAAVAWLNAPTV